MIAMKKTKRLIYMAGMASASVSFPLSHFFAHKFFLRGAILDDVLLAAIVAAVVIIFMYQRALTARVIQAHKLIEEERLRAFHATMVTIFDILGNFLNNMELVRLDVEESLPKESLELFDELTSDVQTRLHALDDLEILTEKKMAIGIGLQYSLPKAPLQNSPPAASDLCNPDQYGRKPASRYYHWPSLELWP